MKKTLSIFTVYTMYLPLSVRIQRRGRDRFYKQVTTYSYTRLIRTVSHMPDSRIEYYQPSQSQWTVWE